MTRYDEVIPPGGTGKVTLTIDTNRVRGEFEKKAVVWSNDFERMSIVLRLIGEVKPHIAIEPGGFLSFQGVKGRLFPEHLNIINNHESPFKIIEVDNDLTNHIKWQLKEIEPGFVYRLNAEDVSKKAGTYTGHLIVRTDSPKKPQLTIIVTGDITSE